MGRKGDSCWGVVMAGGDVVWGLVGCVVGLVGKRAYVWVLGDFICMEGLAWEVECD